MPIVTQGGRWIEKRIHCNRIFTFSLEEWRNGEDYGRTVTWTLNMGMSWLQIAISGLWRYELRKGPAVAGFSWPGLLSSQNQTDESSSDRIEHLDGAASHDNLRQWTAVIIDLKLSVSTDWPWFYWAKSTLPLDFGCDRNVPSLNISTAIWFTWGRECQIADNSTLWQTFDFRRGCWKIGGLVMLPRTNRYFWSLCPCMWRNFYRKTLPEPVIQAELFAKGF